MTLVCLDTNIVIWGILGESNRISQHHMIPKAQAFLRLLEREHHQIMIPAVVLTEILLGIPIDAHVEVIKVFQRNFRVYPYDTTAAPVYARIWQTLNNGRVRQAMMERGTLRSEIEADCMIVATAIAHGATCIFSNDDDIRQIAFGYIKCETMPDVFEQGSLFD